MDTYELGFADGHHEGRAAIRGRPMRVAHAPKIEHHQMLAQNYALDALATRFKDTFLAGEPWSWDYATAQRYVAGYVAGFMESYGPAVVNPTWGDVGADLHWIGQRMRRDLGGWRPPISPAQSAIIGGGVMFTALLVALWIIVTHVAH